MMPPKGEKRSRQSCLGQVSEDEAADPKKSRPQKAIFVKNLPPNVTEEQVMALHSDIQKTKLEVAKNISKTKYALLDFPSEESAKDAVQRINGMELDGYKLFVDYLESSAMVSYNQSDVLSQGQDPLKLYVTGFGQSMTEHRLAELFPTASSFKLELHPQTKKSVGFAFIHFEDASEAKRVHDSMQETMFDGRVLVVMHAKQDSIFDEASTLKRPRLDHGDEAEDCSEDEEEDDNDGDGDDIDDDDDGDSEFT